MKKTLIVLLIIVVAIGTTGYWYVSRITAVAPPPIITFNVTDQFAGIDGTMSLFGNDWWWGHSGDSRYVPVSRGTDGDHDDE